jgi:endoglucanase
MSLRPLVVFIELMQKESKDFLYELLTTPSPTGFEEEIQHVVRTRMERYADTIETDLHGNVIAAINPKAQRRVMLAGHCDQIGFMVKHITKDGFVYVSPLGGIDAGVLLGTHVTIHAKGGAINGIFGRKPIHQQSAEERDRVKLDLDKMWVDIGAKTQKEAEKRIAIGDPVTFKLGVTELGPDLVSSPGLDNRVGLFVAMETLRLCAKEKLSVGLFSVSTVQEEVGLRGARTAAFSVDPEVGIAIDVTHASDNPANDNAKAVPCKLGSGPCFSHGPNTNPVVADMLVAAAKKLKIPYQPAPSAQLLGNDANAIQVSRGGVATGSIGIPNRYMHTQVEVCSLADLENAARVLAGFVKSISAKTDFRPMRAPSKKKR